MKTIDLQLEKWSLADLVSSARREPILILDESGAELLIARADDFDTEIGALRNSLSFQELIEARRADPRPGRPIEEVIREVDEKLAAREAEDLANGY